MAIDRYQIARLMLTMKNAFTQLWLLVLCAPAVAGGEATASTPEGRPNIVVFMVDDLGWQDVSLPLHTESTVFNRRYRTPNVERLARAGVRFTNAYAAAPVCTPTRASLMTGQSPGQMGITYWILHGDRDTSRRHPLVRPPDWKIGGLQPDDVTLPQLLSDSGYRTIHIGKAHLGARGTAGADPHALGFERNVAGHAAGAPGSYYGRRNFSSSGGRKPGVWDVPGLEEFHGKDVFLTDVLAELAEREVRAAAEDERPFFLHFATYAVHTPIQENSRHSAHYPDLHPRERAYATLIESADAALGRVLDLLEELHLVENTFVVFTSDNGGLSAVGRGGPVHTHNAPLRSGKGSAYEGGLRVPQVARYPGVLPGGAVVHDPVITTDLFATIVALAGATLPSGYADSVEGVDWLPKIARKEALPERALFWHQPHQWGARGPGIFPFSAIRRGSWKLIFRHADREFELYDLERDIGERRNLTMREPERVSALARELGRWCETRDVQMSIDIADGEAIAVPR